MTNSLQEQTIGTFLDTLASSAPTPGGGSVAALNGAMAAGLISMVCAVTLARNKQNHDAEEMQAVQQQAEQLRMQLQTRAQEDIEIFEHLSAAYKLPRTTDADAATRRAAIQKITRQATEVPLKTAHHASSLLPLCTALVHTCGRLLVSDIGVAALLARSSVQSALLNVEINLSSLDDELFVRDVRAQVEDITVGLAEETRGVVEIVQNRIRQ